MTYRSSHCFTGIQHQRLPQEMDVRVQSSINRIVRYSSPFIQPYLLFAFFINFIKDWTIRAVQLEIEFNTFESVCLIKHKDIRLVLERYSKKWTLIPYSSLTTIKQTAWIVSEQLSRDIARMWHACSSLLCFIMQLSFILFKWLNSLRSLRVKISRCRCSSQPQNMQRVLSRSFWLLHFISVILIGHFLKQLF